MPARVRLGCVKEETIALGVALEQAHARVLGRGVFREGPERANFEREFGAFLGSLHVIGVASGSAALTIALKALGVGIGDEVLVPANVDISAAAPVGHTGARPVWCDVDERTLNVDPRAMRRSIGDRTRAAVVVHMYGNPADLDGASVVASEHRFPLVEDASHAVGAEWAGRKCGTVGRLGVISLSSGKPLSALGAAGAIVTQDAGLADEVRMLASYGLEPADLAAINAGHAFPRFRCRAEGYNASLDEVQSAALSVKLQHLIAWIERRRRLRELYLEELEDEPEIVVQAPEDLGSPVARHLAVKTPWRDELVRHLDESGIETNIGYVPPLHSQAIYARDEGNRELPTTERLSGELVCLPLHPYLEEHDVRRIARIAMDSVRAARTNASARPRR